MIESEWCLSLVKGLYPVRDARDRCLMLLHGSSRQIESGQAGIGHSVRRIVIAPMKLTEATYVLLRRLADTVSWQSQRQPGSQV